MIENGLRAAGCSQSGAKLQSWHFTVVTNPDIKSKIRQAAEEVERKHSEDVAPEEWLDVLAPLATDVNKPFLETAPCLLMIAAKK